MVLGQVKHNIISSAILNFIKQYFCNFLSNRKRINLLVHF